jgi:ubiquinone/menaquinone biosynthesis C-methylase UbiE
VLSVTDAAAALNECRRVIKTEGAILVSDIYDPAARSGVYSKAHWLALFEEAGFCRTIFEDHTQALRNFVAQLIWRGHSLEDFKASAACAVPEKPGYFTLIAQNGKVQS